MLKKLCLTLTMLLASFKADCKVEMPQEFFISQHFLSWTTSFDVTTRTQKIGTVHRRFFSLTVEYDLYDTFQVLQANARMRILSLGATFDVTDNLGNSLGTINEQFFSFFPTFDVIAPNGNKMAVAKMNLWGTTYDFTDPVTDHVFAQMHRPFLRLKDDWTFTLLDRNIFNYKVIDPRLFIILAAFQTDRDFWQAQARNNTDFKCDGTLRDQDTDFPKDSIASIITDLSSQLERYRPVLYGIEPSQDDIDTTEYIIDEYLNNCQVALLPGENRLAKGIQLLMALFESNNLSDQQKSCLFLMIENALKQLK